MSRFTYFASAVALLVITGCQAPNEAEPWANIELLLGQGWGRVRVHLDEGAPHAPYAQALVEVVRIDLHSQSEDRWYRIPMVPVQVDLLDVSAQFGAVLARAAAPAGVYDQVRFVTTEDGEIVKENGSRYPLKIPSGPSSGLKFFFEPGIEVRECGLVEARIALDFAKSLHWAGPHFIFKPVVKTRVDQRLDLSAENVCIQAPSYSHPTDPPSEPEDGSTTPPSDDDESGDTVTDPDGDDWVFVIGI